MRKLFAKIHLWLSIPLGLLVTLICFTGAMLVFDTEISEAIHPERYFVDRVGASAIPLDKLVPMVNAQLKDNSVESVQVPSDSKRNYVVLLAEGRRVSAYVNPYTGKVVEVSSFMDTFFGKVMGLHRWLLLGATEVGKNIVGYTTLFFVFILISGIVIWWPKTKKQIKTRFSVKTGSGAKRFFYDSHASLGIYLSIVLLVLALTGLTWSFDWYRQGFYALFGVKMEQRGEGGPMMHGGGASKGQRPLHPEGAHKPGGMGGDGADRTPGMVGPVDYTHWQMAYENVKGKVSNFKYITVGDATASVAPLNPLGNVRGTDKYSFDPKSGTITDVKLYADSPDSSKIRGWIYSVHVGAWGGLLTKILTFLFALIGGTLPLTGYYIYFFKRKKKFQSK